MPRYRLIKTHTVWETAIVEAPTKEDAWALADDWMEDGDATVALEWHPYKEGDAHEEIIHVEREG